MCPRSHSSHLLGLLLRILTTLGHVPFPESISLRGNRFPLGQWGDSLGVGVNEPSLLVARSSFAVLLMSLQPPLSAGDQLPQAVIIVAERP